MKRELLEKYLGKEVELKIFEGDTITGELHKTGEKMFKHEPNLYYHQKYYFLINPQSSFIFRSSHVKTIKEVTVEHGEPKKVLKLKEKLYGLKYDRYECPYCHKLIARTPEYTWLNICPHCEQPIKWGSK